MLSDSTNQVNVFCFFTTNHSVIEVMFIQVIGRCVKFHKPGKCFVSLVIIQVIDVQVMWDAIKFH